MDRLRWVGRAGLALGLLTLVLGVIATVGSAILAGDWWLARQPWIGIGLALLVAGLAMTGACALLLDAIEPIGWLRLLAVPPALLIGGFWAYWLAVGLPTTSPCSTRLDSRSRISPSPSRRWSRPTS